MKKTQVEDVTDAQARATKGKLPRNIVYSLATVAAVVVGTLGYYYQSRSDAEIKQKAEEQKAARLRDRTSASEQGNSLDQEIRKQQEEARAEAARQKALAGKQNEPAGKAPILTAQDFGGSGQSQGGENLSKKSNEDALFTAPIFKSAGQLKNARASGQANLSGLPDPAQMRAMQQAAAAGAGGVGVPPGQEPATVSSDRQFLNETSATKTLRTSFSGVLPKCTLSRGFVIPATFVGGNNSDKPGEFRATVDQDVYDTVDGTCKVIAAGTTLVGAYSPDIAIGQERLLAAFIRMQMPNGKVVPLLGMQGADPNGYAGISGDVNNHFFKIFSGAVIIGFLEQRFNNTATATTATPGGLTTYGNTAGQVAAQTALTILNRNQNIRPTITTEPGQRMLVQVKHDMVLEPYRD